MRRRSTSLVDLLPTNARGQPLQSRDRRLKRNLAALLPEGWVVKLYARSGLALRHGLVLANSVGIIDSDYVDPVFVIVQNTTNKYISIKNGSRICQGYMDMVPLYHLKDRINISLS